MSNSPMYPVRRPVSRSIRAHAVCIVDTCIPAVAVRPTACSSRTRSSLAARFVNVQAMIDDGAVSRSRSSRTMCAISTCVLPDPGPATISSGFVVVGRHRPPLRLVQPRPQRFGVPARRVGRAARVPFVPVAGRLLHRSPVGCLLDVHLGFPASVFRSRFAPDGRIPTPSGSSSPMLGARGSRRGRRPARCFHRPRIHSECRGPPAAAARYSASRPASPCGWPGFGRAAVFAGCLPRGCLSRLSARQPPSAGLPAFSREARRRSNPAPVGRHRPQGPRRAAADRQDCPAAPGGYPSRTPSIVEPSPPRGIRAPPERRRATARTAPPSARSAFFPSVVSWSRCDFSGTSCDAAWYGVNSPASYGSARAAACCPRSAWSMGAYARA